MQNTLATLTRCCSGCGRVASASNQQSVASSRHGYTTSDTSSPVTGWQQTHRRQTRLLSGQPPHAGEKSNNSLASPIITAVSYNFAQLARPLHRLTERTATLVWTDQCQDSFDTLRRCLCSSPVLAYPDFSRPFILDTDASDVGIGGVLSQLDVEGRERVVAYSSRLLSKPERRYCVTRRELPNCTGHTWSARSSP